MSLKIAGSKDDTRFNGVVQVSDDATKMALLHSNKLSGISSSTDLCTVVCVNDFSGGVINDGKLALTTEQYFFDRLFYHSKSTPPFASNPLGIATDFTTIDCWSIKKSTANLCDIDIYIGLDITDKMLSKVIPVHIRYNYDTGKFNDMVSTVSSHHKPFFYSTKASDVGGDDFLLAAVKLTNTYLITNGTYKTNIYTNDFNKCTVTFKSVAYVESDWHFF